MPSGCYTSPLRHHNLNKRRKYENSSNNWQCQRIRLRNGQSIMAKVFKQNNFNVITSDLNLENLKKAKENLDSLIQTGNVELCVCDVTNTSDIKALIDFAKEKFNEIDIWINNAGVNQPEKAIWELTEDEINTVINVDLKGTVLASNLVMQEMIKNKKGAIANEQ